MSDKEIFIKRKKSEKKNHKKKKDDSVEKINNAFTDNSAQENVMKKFADEIINVDKEITDKKDYSKDDITAKRLELIEASKNGYITAKAEYLKKCGVKAINKKYEEFMTKRKKDADMFLTDLLISHFSDTLGGLDAIEDPKELADELKKNNLLKEDVIRAVGLISPYVPLIGLLSGIAITGKHVYNHKIASHKENLHDQ